MTASKTADQSQFEDPKFARFLFGSTKLAWLWLVVRVYVGWQWLNAGWAKLHEPGWMAGGASLQAFWQRIVAAPVGGSKGITQYGWYHDFIAYMLQHGWYVWFGKLVAFGETAIGIMLILGAFVGIAAFLGAFMNFNYLLAGTASTNPVLLVLAVLLILAWKVAGYYGLDYWLLPLVGVPWQNKGLFGKAKDTVHHEHPPQTPPVQA
jgi:thiosulfate dehydrogenase (quinone) large subunit